MKVILAVPLVFTFFSQILSAACASSYNETALLSSGSINLGEWEVAYQKAVAFVSKLTNEVGAYQVLPECSAEFPSNYRKKIELITGSDITSQNFTALDFDDNVISPMLSFYVSEFSAGLAVAMTWDKDLVNRHYTAVGKEHYYAGAQVINGPMSQPLGRSPWGGRGVEGYGPDSYLNGITFGIATRAIGSAGIVVGGKHFILNEQETNREAIGGMDSDHLNLSFSDSYSVTLDDKALHETYLRPFSDSIKAGMGALMCSMNRLNETYACETATLLNKMLKSEMGFPGLVYADVSAQRTAFGSANSGLDYASGSTIWTSDAILAGISNSSLTQDRLDDMAVRSLIAWYHAGLDTADQPENTGFTGYRSKRLRANHKEIIRQVGAASLVLLKNDNNTLPLRDPLYVAIFGAHAGAPMAGPNLAFTVGGQPDTYQGHATTPGGSGGGATAYVVTPQHAFIEKAREDGTMLTWLLNDTYTSNLTLFDAWSIDSPNSNSSDSGSSYYGTGMTPGISNYASAAEYCVVFLNSLSGEGGDRSELRNADQDTLVNIVADNCNNTIVVLNSVGPRVMDAWIEHENVKSVLFGSLLGQESGYSIIDVLYGDVNPSARLPFTIPKNESQVSHFKVCDDEICSFSEGNYIDYKYFDQQGLEPRFEFGFGLSYTNFAYSSASITMQNGSLSSGYMTGALIVGGREDLWYDALTVSVNIKNVGTLAGSEVAQLYITFPDKADQPVRQLRGFDKVTLEAGSSGTARFTLQNRDLAYWDVGAQEWAIATGEYTLAVGASSRDIKTMVNLTVS
ncbi:glycoside hydrolase [Gymnopus androsaceus JB14]|uniref:beta-glucosidase n=1 Tax=Gymnopus androsaceus JB14 TaxID=1447944 RepID=A0A6A4HFW3_9AGAR|nr:glycoside hydrolase [Gymnopus androsaceus JB14]